MREIKFRAWDKENKTMVDSNSVVIYLGCAFKENPSFDSNSIHLFANELMPMQYTGLKDKSGVEIYEGDIVIPCRGARSVEVKAETKMLTSQGHGDCGYQAVTTWFVSYGDGKGVEVIGNIYENPELLEGDI